VAKTTEIVLIVSRSWKRFKTYGSWFFLAFQSLYCLRVWKVSMASHVVLLFDVLSRVIVKSFVMCQQYVKILVIMLTFDPFLFNIPTRSHRPTIYWPRFQPLWSPDTGWNPTTSERSFQLPPFTSIQLAVILRNDAFVLSAVHPSAVDEIPPGASYAWMWVQPEGRAFATYNDFGFQHLQPVHKLVMDIDLNIVSTG
jgi:hypothetical protein